MPKIKLTKGELKTQRDALKQFSRFLPTLQLKKQQLQMETRKSQDRVEANRKRENEFKNSLTPWISLFGNKEDIKKFTSYIKIEKIKTEIRNIAGVAIPIYIGIDFSKVDYDLFTEEVWIDDAIKAICDLIEIRAERDILIDQFNLISNELRTTTQRVNLFEKVKIPESKNNIRKIQIYLGDQMTSAVGRSKIAKKKLAEVAV